MKVCVYTHTHTHTLILYLRPSKAIIAFVGIMLFVFLISETEISF